MPDLTVRVLAYPSQPTFNNSVEAPFIYRVQLSYIRENEAGFEKMQVTAKMVTVALDLYFKSTSLKKIVDHLDQFYERHLHHTTILFWARKYGDIISEYAESLEPNLGTIWHADEMKIKTKREDWAWLWHVMDNETRYMVPTS
ncbi:MAG: hypothetical protein WA130_16355 [Candidatus Methanoperedens sp.]